MSKIDQVHLRAVTLEDGKRTYTHIFVHNFLNIQLFFNPQKVCIKINIMEHLDQWKFRVSILIKKYFITKVIKIYLRGILPQTFLFGSGLPF